MNKKLFALLTSAAVVVACAPAVFAEANEATNDVTATLEFGAPATVAEGEEATIDVYLTSSIQLWGGRTVRKMSIVGRISRASCTNTSRTKALNGLSPRAVKRSIMACVTSGRMVPRKVMVTISQNTVESMRTGNADESSVALTNTVSRMPRAMRLRRLLS